MYKLILGFLLLATLNACAVFNTSFDQDQTANFQTYKTFAWLVKQPVIYKDNFDNDILENNIKNIASEELIKRGLRVDTVNPDLIIDFKLQVENKINQQQVPIYGHPYNYGYGYRNYGYNYGYTGRNSTYYNAYMQPDVIVGYRTQNIPYKDGTLHILVIDRKANKLIWNGAGEEVVTDPSSYEIDIRKGIPEIFKNYPIADTTIKQKSNRF